MAVVAGLNIGVGLLVLIIMWTVAVLAVIALAAVPKARYFEHIPSQIIHDIPSQLASWSQPVPAGPSWGRGCLIIDQRVCLQIIMSLYIPICPL